MRRSLLATVVGTTALFATAVLAQTPMEAPPGAADRAGQYLPGGRSFPENAAPGAGRGSRSGAAARCNRTGPAGGPNRLERAARRRRARRRGAEGAAAGGPERDAAADRRHHGAGAAGAPCPEGAAGQPRPGRKPRLGKRRQGLPRRGPDHAARGRRASGRPPRPGGASGGSFARNREIGGPKPAAPGLRSSSCLRAR